MNFAEGIKRVYMTLAGLVWVISGIALFDDRPREDRYDSTTAEAIKDVIVKKAKVQNYDIDFGKESSSALVARFCTPPVENRFDEIKALCNNHNHAKTELPKDLAYHAAYSAGVLGLVALVASLLWMLLAWIGRGFVQRKP